jgi:hypothetical protein
VGLSGLTNMITPSNNYDKFKKYYLETHYYKYIIKDVKITIPTGVINGTDSLLIYFSFIPGMTTNSIQISTFISRTADDNALKYERVSILEGTINISDSDKDKDKFLLNKISFKSSNKNLLYSGSYTPVEYTSSDTTEILKKIIEYVLDYHANMHIEINDLKYDQEADTLYLDTKFRNEIKENLLKTFNLANIMRNGS